MHLGWTQFTLDRRSKKIEEYLISSPFHCLLCDAAEMRFQFAPEGEGHEPIRRESFDLHDEFKCRAGADTPSS